MPQRYAFRVSSRLPQHIPVCGTTGPWTLWCDTKHMNPFATIPIEERYAEFHKRYPALNLIGNTRMVELLCFKQEFPEVQIYAKAEYANPGGSLKDRPVRRMLLEALIQGKIGKGQIVLDSSSGNAGIAYAMLGAMMNLPIT